MLKIVVGDTLRGENKKGSKGGEIFHRSAFALPYNKCLLNRNAIYIYP